ncbi:MAG: CHAT domain-containing protein [Betaproteobacteria bacterium]|nr:CHAT domain-containing protein [Betaproteobacteria bacterium]
MLLLGCEQDGFRSQPLYDVVDELRGIAEAWQPLRHPVQQHVLSPDEGFSARAPLADWPRFDVIHLACHGSFVPESPLDASLYLGNEALRASELFGVDLKAEVVCMSACDVGRHGEQIDGVALVSDEWLGLAMPLFQAGARHVLTSLWAAQSAVACAFMQGFHAALAAGKTPAQAHRQASLSQLHCRFGFWANWQLAGFPPVPDIPRRIQRTIHQSSTAGLPDRTARGRQLRGRQGAGPGGRRHRGSGRVRSRHHAGHRCRPDHAVGHAGGHRGVGAGGCGHRGAADRRDVPQEGCARRAPGAGRWHVDTDRKAQRPGPARAGGQGRQAGLTRRCGPPTMNPTLPRTTSMTDKRITPAELNRRLADLSIPESELAAYFVVDDERSGLFHPKLQLNPATVALPVDPAEARARSEAAMNFRQRHRAHAAPGPLRPHARRRLPGAGAGVGGRLLVPVPDQARRHDRPPVRQGLRRAQPGRGRRHAGEHAQGPRIYRCAPRDPGVDLPALGGRQRRAGRRQPARPPARLRSGAVAGGARAAELRATARPRARDVRARAARGRGRARRGRRLPRLRLRDPERRQVAPASRCSRAASKTAACSAASPRT